MNKKDFVHLHLHSDFSLLDGAIKINPLPQRAQQLNARAVAVTDHGNLYGAISFYNQMKASAIKPIIGMEAYIAKGRIPIAVMRRAKKAQITLSCSPKILRAITTWQNYHLSLSRRATTTSRESIRNCSRRIARDWLRFQRVFPACRLRFCSTTDSTKPRARRRSSKTFSEKGITTSKCRTTDWSRKWRPSYRG